MLTRYIQLLEKVNGAGLHIRLDGDDLHLTGATESIAPELIESIRQEKKGLVAWLREMEHLGNQAPVATAVQKEYYLASIQQQRIYTFQQLNPASTSFNLPVAFRIKGKVVKEKITATFHLLADRHQSLRTVFVERNEEICQYLKATATDFVTMIPFCPGDDVDSVIRAFVRPFDLSGEQLFRVGILSFNEEEHLLLFDMHHIVADGVSQNLIFNDFMALYDDQPLPPLATRYVDYSEWQHSAVFGQQIAQQREYWLKQFTTPPDYIDLPLGKTGKSYAEVVSCNYQLPTDEIKLLKQVSADYNTTPFTVLLAIYSVFLNRISRQQEFCIGTPATGRTNHEFEQVVGMFVNTLPVKVSIAEDTVFESLLLRLRENVINAFEHQEYPYELLAGEIGFPSEQGKFPLFNTWFFYNRDEFGERRMKDIVLEKYNYIHEVSKWDVTMECIERGPEVCCCMTFAAGIFSSEAAVSLSALFGRVLRQLLLDPRQGMGRLELMDAAQYNAVVTEYNHTTDKLDEHTTVVLLIETNCKLYPDKIAVQSGNTNITYAALAAAANLVAEALARLALPANTIIGVLMDRSAEVPAVILGILRAGYSWLPFNLNDPPERIAYILKASDCSVVILNKLYVGKIAGFKGEMIFAEDIRCSDTGGAVRNFNVARQSDRAYIIYTSGTTGVPKGVEIGHRSLLNYITWAAKSYVRETDCNFPLYTVLSFDMVITSLLLPLVTGNSLLIYEGNNEFLLDNILLENKSTVIKMTPSQLGALLEFDGVRKEIAERKDLKLKRIIVGGEQLETHLAERAHIFFNGSVEIYNEYGPTEATVGCMIHRYCPDTDDSMVVPIGRPISNTQIYLLDKNGQLVAPGCVGEICIAGDCLAYGYRNDPEKTAERFVPVPFREHLKMYRTGDMARMLPNLTMEYLGRSDDQVKIRGHRVELGEVEAALLSYAGITNGKAVAWSVENGSLDIYAYFVAPEILNISAIKTYLLSILPPYACPARIVQLDAIPLTPSGKVDRKKLPREVRTDIVILPRNDEEILLLDIWKEALKVEKIGMEDDFYQLGGDSIKALRVMAKINRRFGVKMAVQDMLNGPTIEKLARNITSAVKTPDVIRTERTIAEFEQIKALFLQTTDTAGLIEDVFPASDIQTGMIFHTLKEPGSTFYHDHMIHQVYYENFNFELFGSAVVLLAGKHPVLRTAFSINDVQPLQIVYKEVPRPLDYRDISSHGSEEQQTLIHEFLRSDLNKPFNVFAAPLWRLTVFRIGANEVVMTWIVHHAIIDGWSDAVFKSELHDTYLRLKEDPGYTLTPLKNSYKDYVIAENANRNNPAYETYWKQQLDGFKRLDIYPSGKHMAENQRKRYRHKPADHLIEEVYQVSKRYNISIKNLCFGAYLFGIYMLSWENDVLVGIIDNNRPVTEDGDRILGCFLNVLPVRFVFQERETWAAYFHRVDRKLKEVISQGKITFLDILKFTEKEIGETGSIVNATFNYVDFHVLENVDYSQQQALLKQKLDISSYSVNNFEIDFTFSKTLDEHEMLLHYSSHLMSEEMAAGLCTYMEAALYQLIHANAECVDKKQVLKADPLQEFITMPYYMPPEKFSIKGSFLDKRCADPGKTAISSVKGAFTYKTFEEETNRIANFLVARGVTKEVVVAIAGSRSLEMVLWIYGILKAGGAYLPVNPGLSAKKMAFMLEDSGAALLVSDTENWEKYSGPVDKIDMNNSLYADFPVTRPVVDHEEGDLAYIIYTSGSTGNPKGVMIDLGSLISRLTWMQQAYPLFDADVMLLKTPVYFDVSAWELFSWCMAGASLFILSPEEEKSPEQMITAIAQQRVSILYFVPSMLSAFLEVMEGDGLVNELKSVRRVFSTGEALNSDLAGKFDLLLTKTNNVALVNMYGPTEATIEVTWYDCSPATYTDLVPIGRAVDHVCLWIVDRCGQMQPVGVAGELCISGAGLARGYVNNEEQTSLRFGPNPVLGLDRVYRTGDLARWLPDGNIDFLGRIDRQLKIRGNRVEPGEIEHSLLGINGITDACVIMREGILCGYYSGSGAPGEAQVRATLATDLPDHMIPGALIKLTSFPLTGSGKKDVQSLPAPDMREGEGYVAPESDEEKAVVSVWSKVLGHEQVGVTANFFLLGGDSIKAIQVISRLRGLGYTVTMKDVFDHPVAGRLARQVQQEISIISQEAVKAPAPLSPSGDFTYAGISNEALALISKKFQ
ncbi:non-ribosomal peptide synthetase [Chitinophaga sp. OAE865]|uniref:non-ribosomal peptide synthetase n=1 Tax=Chitinophaga sp. OAE865 TaxID=2817898 RepID=UPI001AE9B1D1